MADNSSNNSSGPRNWRDRVGVKGGMPKLADEFRTEPKISTPPAPASAPERPRQSAGATPASNRPVPNRPAVRPAAPQPRAPAPSASRPAPTPVSRPVSRPAPMAPRRPTAAAPAPKPPQATPVQAPTVDERSNAFAERLRAQRAAAEALANKRSEETRNRLSGAASMSGGPKFSFAEEELKAATKATTVENPAAAAPRPHVAAAPAAPARPSVRPPEPPVAEAPAAPKQATPAPARPQSPPRPVFRPTQSSASAPPAYQPSDAYRQTHGYREFDNNQTPPARPVAPVSEAPTGQDRYAEAPASEQPGYTPPARSGYQAPQSRQPYYSDDAADDVFGDGQTPGRSTPRRAGASDYSAAYRDYDDAFDYDEEPRRRGGIWIFVVLMLIVVAAIAAGAYYFINYGSKIGSNTPATGNVPTVTAPQQPVKVAPKPVDKTTTPGAPVRRKKIYDRILGNETLEPEKLVPSEETPKMVPPPVVPQAAPTGDAPIGVQPLPLPLPPPPTIPGVQGGVQGGDAGKANKVAGITPGSGKTGQTIIAPTAARETTTMTTTGGQQAPLALPAPPVTTQATAPLIPAPVTETLPAPPLPRAKPANVIARARQAAEQQKLAALARRVAPPVPVAPRQPLTSTGPVQLSPGTSGGQNFNAPTAPRQPNTNIASLPQPKLPPGPSAVQQPPTAGSGYVLQMATFRDRNAASAEYRRLISRHGSILRGLSPEIKEGDLGVSGKFYKLRLGAVTSRGKASQLCNALIAAGEKDCLVRSR